MSKSYIPPAIRERVASAARYRCGYCLTSEMIVGTPMELDHLLPESLGGASEENNLWLACSLCNDYKSNRIVGLDTYTGKTEPLFNPRSQDWHEHFEWSENGTAITGKTSIGRATVATLRLNRESLVRARRLWVLSGWHPPRD